MAKTTDFKPFRSVFRIFNVVSAQNTQNSSHELYMAGKSIKRPSLFNWLIYKNFAREKKYGVIKMATK